MNRPAAADGGKRSNAGKGERHTGEHRQRAADEGLPGTGKDEGKNRQDAWTEDRQHTCEIRNNQESHHRFLCNDHQRATAPGLEISHGCIRRRRRIPHVSELDPMCNEV